jgi:hypothetical protein
MAFGDNIFLKGLKRAEQKKERDAQTSFQQGAWRGKKEEGKSATDDFMREMRAETEAKDDPFVTALHTIARTANVLANAKEGESEKNLAVTWSGGKETNGIDGHSIFLSPDVIARETTLKPEWPLPERVDVLAADALMLSTLKRTAERRALERVQGDELASDLWYSLESLNAEREILEKFPGFEDYFAASRTYYSDKNAKAMLECRIGMAEMLGQGDPQGAVAALKWEMMYPDQPLTLPENYRKAVDWAKEQCLETDSSMSRAGAASDINEKFLEWFPCEKSGGGEGDPKKGSSSSSSSSEGEPSDSGGEGKGDNKNYEDEEKKDEEKKEDDKKDEEKKDEEKKEDDKKDDKKDEGKDKKDDGKCDGEKEKKDEGKGKDDKKDEPKPEPKPEKKPLPKLPNIGQARRSLASVEKNTSHRAVAGKTAEIKPDEPSKTVLEVQPEDANSWKNGCEITKMKPDGMLLPYRKNVNKLRARIGALKNRIKLQAEEAVLFHRGLKSGGLDDGSLFKLGIDRKEETLFELREILAKPSIAFGLLIDESGSMRSTSSFCTMCCTRSAIARDVAIMLAEALSGFDGLKLCVMGHTTGDNNRGETLWMRHYLTPEHPHIESVMNVAGIADNLDGYAMESAARCMARWFPEIANKHLMVISDGQPAGMGYGGPSAARHMRTVCDKSRVLWGVNIVGIGIDKAYPPEVGAAMYGPGKSVVLDDSMGSLTILANYITRIVQRANVLR